MALYFRFHHVVCSHPTRLAMVFLGGACNTHICCVSGVRILCVASKVLREQSKQQVQIKQQASASVRLQSAKSRYHLTVLKADCPFVSSCSVF